MSDANEFCIALDEFMEEIDGHVDDVMKSTAKAGYQEIVARSPVWSGDYVKSHRIGINKPDESFADTKLGGLSTGKYPDKLSPGQEAALKAAALLKTSEIDVAKDPDIIYISNNVPHALAVETGEDRTPPYGVYQKGYDVALGHIMKKTQASKP